MLKHAEHCKQDGPLANIAHWMNSSFTGLAPISQVTFFTMLVVLLLNLCHLLAMFTSS